MKHANAEGVFVSLVVLAETARVLAAAYEWDRAIIGARLRQLVRTRIVIIEDVDLVDRALDEHAAGRAEFADHLILGKGRQQASAHLIFDKRLPRLCSEGCSGRTRCLREQEHAWHGHDDASHAGFSFALDRRQSFTFHAGGLASGDACGARRLRKLFDHRGHLPVTRIALQVLAAAVLFGSACGESSGGNDQIQAGGAAGRDGGDAGGARFDASAYGGAHAGAGASGGVGADARATDAGGTGAGGMGPADATGERPDAQVFDGAGDVCVGCSAGGGMGTDGSPAGAGGDAGSLDGAPSLDAPLDAPEECVGRHDAGGLPDGGTGPVYFALGWFDGTITLGTSVLTSMAPPGFGNAYLARVSAAGTFDWALPFTCTGYVVGDAVSAVVADGAVYVVVTSPPGNGVNTVDVTLGTVGGTGPTFTVPGHPWGGHPESFVVRYGLDGALQWVRRFGPTQSVADVGLWVKGLEARSGRLFVVGEKTHGGPEPTTGFVFADDGAGDGYATTLDSPNHLVWSIELDSVTGHAAGNTLRIAAADVDTAAGAGGTLVVAPQRRLLDDAGDLVLGGNNVQTIAYSYFLNYSTADPLQIGPGIMTEDAWVGKLHPGDDYRALWAYRIGSPGEEFMASADVLSRGDVIVAGVTDADHLRLFHGGGETRMDFDRATFQGNTAWLARYASDGQRVHWAKSIHSDVGAFSGPIDVDEAGCAVYASGGGLGNTTVGLGEPGEITFPMGAAVGRYLARYSLSTGALAWASPIVTTNSAAIDVIHTTHLGEVIAYVSISDSATIDPGGPNEAIVNVPGEAVYGLARYTDAGTFLAFTVILRQPLVAGWGPGALVALAQ